MEIQELIRRIVFGEATEEEKKYYIDNLMGNYEKSINKPFWEFTKEEEINQEVAAYNNAEGRLKYVDCPKCKNKGLIAVNVGSHYELADCDCLQVRKTLKLMQQSGLGKMLDICSLDKFKTDTEWQIDILEKAKQFITADTSWFFIGGNSGCGKTFICTAIVKEFILQGKQTKYMLWLDEASKLKQWKANDPNKYNQLLDEIKNAEVLYIDDFLKVGKNEEPTKADINLAMEILNYRYNQARTDTHRKYITIISSERNVGEITELDEATGSRIFEMTKPNFNSFVSRGKDKNYRFKGE